MKSWIILGIALLTLSSSLPGQELDARVQVVSPNVQSSNKRVFETLKTSLQEFLNNRAWTGEKYGVEERIECQFVINIEEQNNNNFEGSLQIAYSRPVYKSDYRTPVLVAQDANLTFEYIEYDRLDFAENTFSSNLTSIMAFYVYIIIGMDHDTFSPQGGSKYYEIAQKIVANAQNNGFEGWDNFGGRKNRYWLVDNLTSPAFDNLRSCLYMYHRQGLDLMHDNSKVSTAKNNIKSALTGLEKVHEQRRNSYLMQMFFDAKRQEILSIFNGGEPTQLGDLREVLKKIDGSHSSEYDKMGKG